MAVGKDAYPRIVKGRVLGIALLLLMDLGLAYERLQDVSYVLPGSVWAEAPDLEAIRESLQPGMAVYFH